MAIRTAILEHMIDIADLILDHSIQDYIRCNDMDQEFTWSTDIEILTLAHTLETPILSYDVQTKALWRYAPHGLDWSK